MAFHDEVRYCIGIPNPNLLGDGICHNFDEYNTAACGFDNGDCDAFNEIYPNCKADFPDVFLNNARCDGGLYNTEECGWDGGDCFEYNDIYPTCDADKPSRVGNGVCDTEFNTIECGYDGGDCLPFAEKFPNCSVWNPDLIGDGVCHGGDYNTAECNYDDGDCNAFNYKYPNCAVEDPRKVGDGQCDTVPYNHPDCGYDGGDCDETSHFNYPDCPDVLKQELGDGICQHNTPGCNYDDGDCEFFNLAYPDCGAKEAFRIGDGYCDDEYNTVECIYDGGDCIATSVPPVLFINGEQFSAEDYRKDTRNYAITQTATSIISLLSSIEIIIVISRSIQRFSIPFHRFLLGLSVAVACTSLAQSFSTLPIPASLSKSVWNAHGNKASCQAQGFMIFVGSIGAPLYICSLCIYCYLIVVVTLKKEGRNADAYIKGKIEFFLHAVPIFVSLFGAVITLALDAFHANVTFCFIGSDPACASAEECRRSDTTAKVLFSVFSAGSYFVVPGVIMATLLIMYRTELAQEKKLAQFGAKPLNDDKEEERLTLSRSNNSGRQTRAFVNKTLPYAFVFFLTYLFPIIISIRTLSGVDSGPTLSVMARVFFPLQGFFIFIIFIFPKVVHAKNNCQHRGEGSISWCGAFMKVISTAAREQEQQQPPEEGPTGITTEQP